MSTFGAAQAGVPRRVGLRAGGRASIRILWGLALAFPWLTSCRGLTDPPLPAGAVPFTPPPVFARWWAMTEACSGTSGSLGDVAWYQVPSSSGFERHGRWITGYWSAGSNQIVLAGSTQHDGSAVRHEMLHALVGGSGHSSEMFLQRCGGVVQCNECVAHDDAPAADPQAVVATSDVLDVTIDLAPIDPSGPDGDGFVTLTVTARNTAPYPVSIAPGSIKFFHEVKGGLENGVRGARRGPEVAWFSAGETKQHVFDFRLIDDGYGNGLGPGEYTVVGGYGGKYLSAVLVLR